MFETIFRTPDFVMIENAEAKRAAVGSNTFVFRDIRVTCEKRQDRIAVFVESLATLVSRIRLRWRFRETLRGMVLGDAWERAYGDLEWTCVNPFRSLPWYALVHDGIATAGYGVMVRPGAICSWQIDPEGVTLWLDVRNGGEGVLLNGRRLLAARVVSRVYSDMDAFDAARDFCGRMCSDPLLPPQPVYEQRTLDITWDFLKAIHEDTPEDPEAYKHLKDKLESLALPDVHVEPGSPLRNVIDGRGIHIETGKITLQKGFIGLPVGSGITDLRFDCGVLDVMMTYTEDGIENSVVIGTDGERAVNHLNEPEDTMQLLAAHGYFEGEDTFTVHFRWVEACFEYVWRFVFKDEDVTITETWNSMLPEDPDAVPVTGKLEELEIDTVL